MHENNSINIYYYSTTFVKVYFSQNKVQDEKLYSVRLTSTYTLPRSLCKDSLILPKHVYVK